MAYIATLAALPALSSAEVATVYEILAYHAVGIPFNKKIAIVVQFIVNHYPQLVSTDTSKSTRPTTRRQDFEPLGSPPDWVDGPTFCKAICAFWNNTLSFRESNAYQEYQPRCLSDSELLISSKNKDCSTSPTMSINQSITQAAMQKALSHEQATMQKTLDNRFEQLISRIDTRLAITLRSKTGLPGLPGPPGNSTPRESLATTSNRWNPTDLGYFDSHLDKSYPKGNIIAINKET